MNILTACFKKSRFPSRQIRRRPNAPPRPRILPTRYGALFITLLLAMLAGSANYNNNLGFLLTFLLGSMAIVSVSATIRNITGIEIRTVEAPPVFAGDTAVFELTLSAPSHGRTGIQMQFPGAPPALAAELVPNTPNRVRLSIVAVKRGVLRPETVTMSSVFPLGLFRITLTYGIDARCLVYPKPHWGEVEWRWGAAGYGGEGGAGSVGSEDFQGLTSYRPGDAVQRISWKTYSRGRGLFVKSFTGEAPAAPLLDWDALSGVAGEKRLSILSGFILRLHRNGRAFGLTLPGRSIEPGKGDAHRHRCLAALALFDDDRLRI